MSGGTTRNEQDQQREANERNEPAFALFVAIDWADKKHVWALQEAGPGNRQGGQIEHGVEAVDEWVRGLLERSGGRPIAVCLEQSRGALVYLLMKYSTLVLYPIHPATVRRFRQALYPSGSKDDPKDADLLLDLLLQHRNRLRPWQPDTVPTRRLSNSAGNGWISGLPPATA